MWIKRVDCRKKKFERNNKFAEIKENYLGRIETPGVSEAVLQTALSLSKSDPPKLSLKCRQD